MNRLGHPWATRARGRGLVLLLLALPAALAAQTPARPEFRPVRYEENWAVVPSLPKSDPFDALKHISFADSAGVYLSLGGQIRARGESVDNFLLVDAPTNEDSFGLLRVFLHADLRLGRHLRGFVEGKQAMVFSRDLPGGKRPLDRDEWEIQNAFVEVGGSALTARLGRQELLLGSQRLVSPLDWTNTRRTFDGGRVTLRSSGLALDGFVTRPVVINSRILNEADSVSLFWGGVLRPAVAAPRFAWELYTYVLDQDSVALFGNNGAHERYTVGGRTTGTLGSAATRFDIEGGYQLGTLGARDIGAWFVASDLTRTLTSLPLRPAIGVGFDYSSGDTDATDGNAGTFHQLYPLAHAYAGYMDILGRQNLMEARAVLTSTPAPPVQLRGSVHHFLRASTSDGAYNTAGGVLRAAAGDEKAIGTELDLTAGYRLNYHTRLEVGFGHFWPGAFMTTTGAGAAGSNWFYASTAFTF